MLVPTGVDHRTTEVLGGLMVFVAVPTGSQRAHPRAKDGQRNQRSHPSDQGRVACIISASFRLRAAIDPRTSAAHQRASLDKIGVQVLERKGIRVVIRVGSPLVSSPRWALRQPRAAPAELADEPIEAPRWP